MRYRKDKKKEENGRTGEVRIRDLHTPSVEVRIPFTTLRYTFPRESNKRAAIATLCHPMQYTKTGNENGNGIRIHPPQQ